VDAKSISDRARLSRILTLDDDELRVLHDLLTGQSRRFLRPDRTSAFEGKALRRGPPLLIRAAARRERPALNDS